MNIIINGAGKVGINLIKLLADENHNVTVVDTDQKIVESVVTDYDVIGYCGNGAAFSVQEEAGVERCDLFIAVTGSDELNIMSCMVASKIGAKKTIARVRNTDYSEQLLFMQNKLGIELLLNPELETAADIARTIEFPAATKIETFAKGRIDLAEITVPEGSPLDGIMLRDIRKTLSAAMLICAVQRGDEVFIPAGNFVVQAGDKIHFTASRRELPRIFKTIKMDKKKIRSVLIIGGSRTAFYLARYLLKSGIKVKIIEANRDRAVELESGLKDCSVIWGDGTDPDLLREERLENFDAAVALTQIDEENIIFCMHAAKQGVDKTACKVNRDPLAKMVEELLPDCSVVCPKQGTADIILRYIRAVTDTSGGIKTLYKILGGEAEAAEFLATDDCPLVGKSLKEIELKKNTLIACVSRGRQVIIPDGNTEILSGDSVIVITAGQRIESLGGILE